MRTRILPISSVRQNAEPVSPACSLIGTLSQSVVQNATSSMRMAILPSMCAGRRTRLSFASAARAGVFLLQPVVPFRLGVGIVDQEKGRGMAQPALLQGDDGAVLVEELAHEGPQQRAQEVEPWHRPIDDMVDLGGALVDRRHRREIAKH